MNKKVAARPLRSRPPRSVCPLACALDIIGDRWTLLVVRDLACGRSRFADFARSPERIATNILADRLDRLVEQGFVDKHDTEGYRLTAKGKSLLPVATAIAQWGLENIRGTKALLKPRS